MKNFAVLLDSGAYTAWSQGITIDIDEYIEYIRKNDKYITNYINLDVIDDIDGRESYKNWQYMLSKGLKPLPVFHAHADPKYLELYVQQADYICIGAITNLEKSKQVAFLDRIWTNYMTDTNGYPKLKVHGLGITTPYLLLRYPWYSVDSTTWLTIGRYGGIYVPKQTNGKYDYIKEPLRISVSTRSPNQKEDDGMHINTLSEMERDYVLQYLDEIGYKIGKSEFAIVGTDYVLKDTERWVSDVDVVAGLIDLSAGHEGRVLERVIEVGLCNDHILRDVVNFLYFKQLEKYFPPYPTPVSFKKTRTLGVV
jgi:hypothetical protein